ncbi:segmentation protein fushi tarazu-like [Cotesia glomerata]|nr:segmentation protein fushi tarazu-like [Cotesia glomerata]
MEQIYAQNNYLYRQKRIIVAELLGLTEKQIKVWFQNRRMKDKKIGSKKRVQDSDHVLESYLGICGKTNMVVNHVQDSTYPTYNVQYNLVPAPIECPAENHVRLMNFNNCSSESANYPQFQNWNTYNQYQTNVIQYQNYNFTYGSNINDNSDKKSSTANSNFYDYSSCNYQQFFLSTIL